MSPNPPHIRLKNRPLVLLGDLHAQWGKLLKKIETDGLENLTLLCVGDLEIGAKYHEKSELQALSKLNDAFKTHRVEFLSLRGNHDNPAFFEGPKRVELSHFQLLPDYSTLQYGEHTLQVVGGATSIDRVARISPFNYWPTEGVQTHPHLCQRVHTLITHTAPAHCHPQTLPPTVYEWAQEDPELLNDIKREREKLSEIFELCKPKCHIYGHFHLSHNETQKSCDHIALDILELWPYPYQP